MTELTDIFGEIAAPENEILRIAWEAVNRRRGQAKKHGTQQLKLNGRLRENGYVTYDDYEQYMEERKRREQLRFGWNMGRVMLEIKKALLSKGWAVSMGHRETRFYPPQLPAD